MRADHLERITRLAQDAEALAEMAAAVEQMQTLEAGIARAQARLDELTAMNTEEQTKLQGVVTDIAKARAEAAQWREEAQSEVSSIRERAAASAQEVAAKASADAESVLSNATHNAQAKLSKAIADISEAQARARQLLEETEAATVRGRAEAEAASSDAAKQKAELERIENALAETRKNLGL